MKLTLVLAAALAAAFPGVDSAWVNDVAPPSVAVPDMPAAEAVELESSELIMVSDFHTERVDDIAQAILIEAWYFQSPDIVPIIGPWSSVAVLHLDQSATLYDLSGLVAIQPIDEVPTAVDLLYDVDLDAAGNPNILESCWLDKKRIKRMVKTNCKNLAYQTCSNVHRAQCDAMEISFPPHPDDPTCP